MTMKKKAKPLETQIRILQKENSELQERVYESEIIRDKVMELKESGLNIPQWVVNTKKDENHNIPVLFISDIHYGENINPNSIDEINCYNKDVANKRIERMTSRVIRKLKDHNENYPGIVLCRGGDFISGDIHKELKETNDLPALPATTELAAQEIRMIEHFKKAFKNVWIISVFGNHGRNVEKPQSKLNYEHSYDVITTMFIEKHFEDDENVSFYTPKSGDAYFNIFDHTFLLTHGDRIGSRGGKGFIGVSATIARGQHKVRQSYAQIKKPIDYLLIGHFHSPIQLEHTLANGCLVGYSEFARDLRIEPEEASQTLFMVNPKYGVIDICKIIVSDMKEDLQIYKNSKINHIQDSVSITPDWIKKRFPKLTRIYKTPERGPDGKFLKKS